MSRARLTTPTCTSIVGVTWTGPLQHRCPYAAEVDTGTVELRWITAGATFELHALTAWLTQFADQEISHEDITEEIRATLAGHRWIQQVEVLTRWTTAGGEVVVRSAVPGQPHLAEGA